MTYTQLGVGIYQGLPGDDRVDRCLPGHPEDHRQTASKECDHVQLKDLEVASRVDDRDRSQDHRPAEIGRDEQGDGAGAID